MCGPPALSQQHRQQSHTHQSCKLPQANARSIAQERRRPVNHDTNEVHRRRLDMVDAAVDAAQLRDKHTSGHAVCEHGCGARDGSHEELPSSPAAATRSTAPSQPQPLTCSSSLALLLSTKKSSQTEVGVGVVGSAAAAASQYCSNCNRIPGISPAECCIITPRRAPCLHRREVPQVGLHRLGSHSLARGPECVVLDLHTLVCLLDAAVCNDGARWPF